VHDRLAGCSAVVDADVEAVGASFPHQQLPHLGHQVEQCGLLLLGRLEKRGDVPLRNDEAVAGSHGKAVQEGKSVVVGDQDLGFVMIAEWAGSLSHLFTSILQYPCPRLRIFFTRPLLSKQTPCMNSFGPKLYSQISRQSLLLPYC